MSELDLNGRWEVTEEMVAPFDINAVAEEIADEHFTTVVVTPLDEAENPILDDQVIYQNPNE